MSWYGFFKVPFTQFVKHGYKATITGAENIPATGPVILAGNHVSYADTFLTPALIQRQVTLPVKAEVFRREQGFKWRVIGWFLKAVGMVPLDRSGGRAALDGLDPRSIDEQLGHIRRLLRNRLGVGSTLRDEPTCRHRQAEGGRIRLRGGRAP